MPPGSQCVVETGYRSRGLEYLRYIPARMSPTAHYRITVKVDGIPAEKLDYPHRSHAAPSRSWTTCAAAPIH
jgi:hypothetical protein